MKKNKTIAYMLAATLLVGGTFLGTKALFTDMEQVAGELKISTGDVDIEIVNEESTKWNLYRQGNDTNTGTGNLGGDAMDFDNLKTGDYLKKTITVENQGTLKAKIDLEKNATVIIPTGFKGSATLIEKNNDNILLPGEQATIELNIEVIGRGEHNTKESFNSDVQEETTIDLKDAWILYAEQVNGTEQIESQK